MASVRQFMELAVYIPEQGAAGGAGVVLVLLQPLLVQLACVIGAPRPQTRGTDKVRRPSFMVPASMGPPETKMVGMFTRAAAISRPGTFYHSWGSSPVRQTGGP